MKPYISIVASSRNDDHGGDLLRRMNFFIKGLDQQVTRHKSNAELIIVEWNPPSDKPLLHEVLESPSTGSLLTIRYIIVPNSTHIRMIHHDKFSLYQYIAKNVGIRRSKGDFILLTNVDLIFSDELWEFLVQEMLDLNVMYRANRCDISPDFPDSWSLDEQLIFFKNNIITRYGTINDIAPSSESVIQLIRRKIKSTFMKESEGKSNLPFGVDTNACGDFSLMSKSGLEHIKGYPELIFHSKVDGLLCHTAVACGFKQVVLHPNQCTYHIDHKFGWATMSLEEKLKLMQETPFFDSSTYHQAVHWIHSNKKPLPINDDNWGFIKESFQEIVICG